MNDTDNTPLWSKRQLVQSAGQFLLALLAGIGAMSDDGLTWQEALKAVVQAIIVAGGVLGLSYVPTK